MILRKYWKISRTGHDDTIQSSQKVKSSSYEAKSQKAKQKRLI